MPGRHFCVAHPAPRDLAWTLSHGASVMLDNGAFGSWNQRQQSQDWPAFYAWAAPHLRHPHWAVIPDVIDGSEGDNNALIAECPLPRELSAPVWHLHESLDRLSDLADRFPKICFGSSGTFADPTCPAWAGRVDQAWNALDRTGRRPWVHMLRAMDKASSGPWPFGSADSTNIAQNHSGNARGTPARIPDLMARYADSRNPRHTGKRAHQGRLL